MDNQLVRAFIVDDSAEAIEVPWRMFENQRFTF